MRIIKTELWKLKRYRLIWSGVLLMLLSVVITMLESTAMDGSFWDFNMLYEQVIKNNMTTIFPMTITLIVGYIIHRENKDDTLKNIRTIPIKYSKIIYSKLILGGILSIIYGVVSWMFIMIAYKLSGFGGITFQLAIKAFYQTVLMNLFLYIGVLPIIVLTLKLSINFLIGVVISFVYGYGSMFASGNKLLLNIYPITSGLSLVGYRDYDLTVQGLYDKSLSLISLIFVILFTIIIVKTLSNDISKTVKTRKEKVSYRKGW